MSWYRDAESELTEAATAIQSQRPFRIERIEALVNGLVSSLRRNDELVVEALSGPPGPPLITNLINVGILGTRVGIGLGYYGKELDRLALGGLVHDIGLFAVPKSLIEKAGRLTQDERMLIEQHPDLGAQVIHQLGPEYHWLAQLVRQAHERFNGCGYPNRLKGRHISEMAQIIGVVDVFDALVSDRPYRRRLLPHEAVKELLVAERTAFPREILKALIEQLSVYPLGTTVRLTTGEVATVEKVNSRYPFRPVVRIHEQDAPAQSNARPLDLSLTPLVSIIETIDPPAMGRVAFAGGAATFERNSAPVKTSDHFTSLLESLDAIASAIQGVVEIRKKMSQGVEAPMTGADTASWEPIQTGVAPTLHKELAGLFALEARGWLAQIQAALKKLDMGIHGEVRSKLYEFIHNGMTNLARSASAVPLSDIEAMAATLLQILRDIGKVESERTSESLRSFHAGLDRIGAAVQRLAGTDGNVGGPAEPRAWAESRREEPVAESGSAAVTSAPSSPGPVRVASSVPLLRALRELQRVRARSVQPSRDVLEAVIDRAEQEVGPQQDQIAVEAVERILHDLGRLDEEFLKEVRERVPAMAERIRHVRDQGAPDFVTSSQLEPIIVHVDALKKFANTIHAETFTMFLQGLESFLSAAAYRKDDTLPQRLRAVEGRIHTLIPMAEQWVTLGRLELASIEEILPA